MLRRKGSSLTLTAMNINYPEQFPIRFRTSIRCFTNPKSFYFLHRPAPRVIPTSFLLRQSSSDLYSFLISFLQGKGNIECMATNP
jgi:hypothetical protein